MKKIIRSLAVCLLCLTMICLAGCGGKDGPEMLPEDIIEGADISMEDGCFTVTPEECVEVLNKDLKAAGLPLIPEKYEREEDNSISDDDDDSMKNITYTYHIDETIELVMRAFPDMHNTIPGIRIEQFDYGKKLSEDEIQKAKKYYDIVCKNVAPGFDTEAFSISVHPNEAKAGDLYFWCRQMNEDRDGTDGKAYIYVVTAKGDMFDYIL